MALDQQELRHQLIRALASKQGAKIAADTLNKLDVPSATGRPWTRKMVYGACKTLGVKNPYYAAEEIERWRRPRRGLSSTCVLMYE